MSATVALTFDLDAVALWIHTFRTSSPSAISRGEYGPDVGLPRVLDLLARNDLQATFFIPGVIAELYPDSVRQIRDHGHELGSHGDTHERLSGMSAGDERLSLERGIDKLVTAAGVQPEGFRAPAWDLSFQTIGILADLGLSYDSSQFGTDFVPYRARQGDTLDGGEWRRGASSRILEFPIAWELDDVPYFLVSPPGMPGCTEPEVVERIWCGELDYMVAHEPTGVFTLTMHPQVIGRGPRVQMLERFIRYARDLDCSFITLAQARERWEDA